MSATNFKVFFTVDNTTSYTSSPIQRSLIQNRTVVFQATIPTGDTVVLQARLDPSLPFVDVLTATDTNILQEVVAAPEFRVVVTNTSTSSVIAALTI